MLEPIYNILTVLWKVKLLFVRVGLFHFDLLAFYFVFLVKSSQSCSRNDLIWKLLTEHDNPIFDSFASPVYKCTVVQKKVYMLLF